MVTKHEQRNIFWDKMLYSALLTNLNESYCHSQLIQIREKSEFQIPRIFFIAQSGHNGTNILRTFPQHKS